MAPSPSIPSNKDLEAALKSYNSLLEQRSTASSSRTRSPHLPSSSQATLVDLDAHVWTELPRTLATRSRQPGASNASITPSELLSIVAWKLLRGKYRPTLPALVASNSEEKVEEVTGRAWKSFVSAAAAAREKTSGGDGDGLRNFPCLRILTELKGIGPATASLLLAVFDLAAEEAAQGDAALQEGFMSDESWACLPALAGRKIAYGEADWKRWRKAWGERLREWNEGREGAPHGVQDLDRATWSWCVGGGAAATTTTKKRSRSAVHEEDDAEKPAEQSTKTQLRTSKRAR